MAEPTPEQDSSEKAAEVAPKPSGLSAFFSGVQARASALVGRPAFWLITIGLIFAVPLGRTMAIALPEPPKLNVPLPPFELVNQRGEPFGLEDLRGRIWVADFIFTSCPTACPKLTHRMEELQDRGKNLGDAFHLVSFTVDPENDTPERLAGFAEGYHVNQRRWSFLTGDSKEIEKTVVNGFKIAMGKEEASPGVFSIFHGERFVLVDEKGSIRGYYDADDEGLDALLQDVNILVNVR